MKLPPHPSNLWKGPMNLSKYLTSQSAASEPHSGSTAFFIHASSSRIILEQKHAHKYWWPWPNSHIFQWIGRKIMLTSNICFLSILKTAHLISFLHNPRNSQLMIYSSIEIHVLVSPVLKCTDLYTMANCGPILDKAPNHYSFQYFITVSVIASIEKPMMVTNRQASCFNCVLYTSCNSASCSFLTLCLSHLSRFFSTFFLP